MDRKKINLYTEKQKDYYTNIRYDIIELIPRNPNNKILEIGCGYGATLVELKKLKKADYVVGIDIVDMGQKQNLDDFICCDIEEPENLPFPTNFFDIIICADVLEHLIDPWSTLKKLKKYLKSGGYIISSIPNIREIRTMFTIFLKGDFRYVERGILDKTHLRFFCKKNIINLFNETGFKIERVTYKLPLKRNLVNKVFMGLLEEFVVVQYLIVAINENTEKNS
ncbi:methyltransferase domain-containing protein [Thermodesulfovibrio sp. 3907-1M]|uniref:Methyltransferase domain-containing protein n=1 Tax=Thermodesulfovibrio autotrophicus TaxID=3118333 RepID=A0AAU8GZA5_9BACT